MQTALLTLVIGLLIGVVVGALGAGGGILTVPVLVYLLGQEPHSATASSLVIVGLSAIAGLIHHVRAGNVAYRDGFVFSLLSVIGAVIGARLSALVSAGVLMSLFGAMLLIVAIAMTVRGVRTRRFERRVPSEEPVGPHEDPVLDEPGGEEALEALGVDDDARGREANDGAIADTTPAAPRRALLPLVAAASFTGILTGFFGVGGGFIVVPMLVIALGLAMRRAAGTSLLVMITATSVSLIARVGTDFTIDWTVTLVLAAATSAGALVGGPISARARPSTLTFAFALLLAGVAVVTLGEILLT